MLSWFLNGAILARFLLGFIYKYQYSLKDNIAILIHVNFISIKLTHKLPLYNISFLVVAIPGATFRVAEQV